MNINWKWFGIYFYFIATCNRYLQKIQGRNMSFTEQITLEPKSGTVCNYIEIYFFLCLEKENFAMLEKHNFFISIGPLAEIV